MMLVLEKQLGRTEQPKVPNSAKGKTTMPIVIAKAFPAALTLFHKSRGLSPSQQHSSSTSQEKYQEKQQYQQVKNIKVQQVNKSTATSQQ